MFRKFLCPSSRVFHCTHSSGIRHTGYADSLRARSGRTIRIYRDARSPERHILSAGLNSLGN